MAGEDSSWKFIPFKVLYFKMGITQFLERIEKICTNECYTYEVQAVVKNIFFFLTSAGNVLSRQLQWLGFKVHSIKAVSWFTQLWSQLSIAPPMDWANWFFKTLYHEVLNDKFYTMCTTDIGCKGPAISCCILIGPCWFAGTSCSSPIWVQI